MAISISRLSFFSLSQVTVISRILLSGRTNHSRRKWDKICRLLYTVNITTYIVCRLAPSYMSSCPPYQQSGRTLISSPYLLIWPYIYIQDRSSEITRLVSHLRERELVESIMRINLITAMQSVSSNRICQYHIHRPRVLHIYLTIYFGLAQILALTVIILKVINTHNSQLKF